MEIFCQYFDKVLECNAAPQPPPSPPPQAAPAFEVGQFVCIHSLQNRTELNQLEAIIQEILPNGRVQVIWKKKNTPTPRVPPQLRLRLRGYPRGECMFCPLLRIRDTLTRGYPHSRGPSCGCSRGVGVFLFHSRRPCRVCGTEGGVCTPNGGHHSENRGVEFAEEWRPPSSFSDEVGE